MTLVKICEVCGMANPVTEMICQRCFTDITRKRPTDQSAIQPEPPKSSTRRSTIRRVEKPEFDQDKTIREVAPLMLVAGPGQVIMVHHGDTIGRDGVGSKIFSQYSSISRHHATFRFFNGRWLVRDENSTNGTYINGNKITPEKWFELKDKDVLSVSSSCNVTIKL